MIEYSLINKITETLEYFKENYNAILEIKKTHTTNKKISEITESILILLGKAEKSNNSSITQKNKDEVRNKLIKGVKNISSINNNNTGEGQPNSNLGVIEEDIFSSSNNTNQNFQEGIETSNGDNFLDFTSKVDNNNGVNSENTNTSNNKAFAFIKKDNTTSSNSNHSNNNSNLNNILENLDLSSVGKQTTDNDKTIHINQTSNINITVVQTSGDSNQQGKKGGFSFVKEKQKGNNNNINHQQEHQMNGEQKENQKKELDIDELISKAQETTKENNGHLNSNQCNNTTNYLNSIYGNNVNPGSTYGNPYVNNNPYNNTSNGIYYNYNQLGQMGYSGIPPQNNFYGNYNNTNPYTLNANNNILQPNNNILYKSMFEKEPLNSDSHQQSTKEKDNKFSFIDEMMKPKK